MNIFKSHFGYTKQQRNGILFLVLIIAVLQAVYFFVDFSAEVVEENNSEEIALFKKEFDSLQKTAINAAKPKIFPFNPNYLSDFKAYQLGLSILEIDRLLAYRATGKYVNSSGEFQKITRINDSLLAVIQPLFKFPQRSFETRKSYSKKVAVSKPIKNLNDINKATSEELQKIKGVGVKLAERILKYRTSIKGFYFSDQLFEVYGLEKEVLNQILFHFEIKEKPTITKLNINSVTFKEVLALPYIDYELTRKIFNYKNKVVEIQSIEELKKIESFPVEKFNRIALYLTVN